MSSAFATIAVDVQPGGCIEFMGQQMVVNKRIRNRLEDNRDFFKSEEATMSSNFASVWIAQQSVWPALSDRYVRWKIAHGFSAMIGVLTTKLSEGMRKGEVNSQSAKVWTWGIDPSDSKFMGDGGGFATESYPEKFAKKRPFAILLDSTVVKLKEDYMARLMKIWKGLDT